MLPIESKAKKKRKKEPKRNDPRRQLYILGIVAACGLALIGQTYWVSKNKVRFAPFAIERVRCDECKGLGLVSRPSADDSKRLVMCEACFGLGSRQIRRIDDEDSLCPACVGFGRVDSGDDGTWRWCRRCGGRGLIRPPDAPPPTYKATFPIYGSTNVYESLGIKPEDIPPSFDISAPQPSPPEDATPAREGAP